MASNCQKRDPEPNDEKFRELLECHGGSAVLVFDALLDYCSYNTDLFSSDNEKLMQEFSYVFSKHSWRWNSRVNSASKLSVYDVNIQQHAKRRALFQNFLTNSNIESEYHEENYWPTEDGGQYENTSQDPAQHPEIMTPCNSMEFPPMVPPQSVGLPLVYPYRIPMIGPINGFQNNGGPLQFFSTVKFAPVNPAGNGPGDGMFIQSVPLEQQLSHYQGPDRNAPPQE